MEHIVKSVDCDSIAEELGIEPGDAVISINGNEIKDFIDYTYFVNCEELSMDIKTKQGEICTVEIEKDEYEPLGINFENEFMDKQRSCHNKCIFCFIDQMPKKMRDTLYFKDDDWRLSLMMGNYVTLSNVKDDELSRIIERQVSPLYISVHATDKDVRAMMLNNYKNSDIMPKLKALADGGIYFHCQIVLCPTVNDGEVLKKTLSDLYSLGDNCLSVAVVPVGMTKYREGLYKLTPVDTVVANKTVETIKEVQAKALADRGTRFVFASDEIYIKSDYDIPTYEEYEDFGQIEDGIGMYASYKADFELAKENLEHNETDALVLCGTLIQPLMQELLDTLPDKGVVAKAIRNEFFGETITVTGLITGQDIINQLKGTTAKKILIPGNMLKHKTDMFLDNVTVETLKKELPNSEIIIMEKGAFDLIKGLERK